MKTNENLNISEPEVMPKFEIIPTGRIMAFGGRVLDFLFDRKGVPMCHSDHYTGASEMLDQALDNQPELPFNMRGWDSEGRYMTSDGEW